jgi:putative transposase
VNQLADAFSRELLCAMLELPRSTLYYHAQPADDLNLRSALETVALEFPRYGYRRMTAELQRRG